MRMSQKFGAAAAANGGLLRTSMRALRTAFISVGLFSCILNLLMLTGPLFMLQVYDRVLSSRSVPTLVALAALAATLYAFWGLFEFLRHRVMSRAGYWLDQQLGEATFREWMAKSIGGEAEGPRPLVDIAALRQFLSSPGLMGIFDAPWIPIYLAFVFIVHVNLGLLTTAGALIVMILALINQRVTREPLARATGMESSETRFLEQAQRNAEAILPMGMMPSIAGHWKTMHGGGAAMAQNAGERGEFFSATSKAVRMMLQSAILGLGAYYAIYQQISPGMIVAVSIIAGRALAPIDQIIGHWRIIARARQAHQRLTKELAGVGTRPKAIELPDPKGALTVQGLTKFAPGPAQDDNQRRTILANVAFALEPGDALGVIGPSASGKTTLARVLIGAWQPDVGTARLDGATIDQWDRDQLGRHIGYLPQHVELLAGTIQQNISRFDPDAEDGDIVKAAQMAGVHEMILRLPEGYATGIGYGAMPLSSGQVQRIGLARALYRVPHLVVLDEPNSNLDAEGDTSLARAIEALRQAGSIVIVMAHRPSAIAAVNKIMMLMNGSVVEFGDEEDVLRKVTRLPVGGR